MVATVSDRHKSWGNRNSTLNKRKVELTFISTFFFCQQDSCLLQSINYKYVKRRWGHFNLLNVVTQKKFTLPPDSQKLGDLGRWLQLFHTVF